jgi:hypothetical protein
VQVDIFSTFSVALSGIDLILEGEAARVTDPPVLEQLAAGTVRGAGRPRWGAMG